LFCVIDTRYEHIIGYAGLVRFVEEFPRYNAATETYVRKEKAREQPDGEFHLIPGMRFLPLYIFGPLSARPADASVLRTSNLSNFLFSIQRGLWSTVAGAEIIFSVFGDGAYNLGLPCISSYFRSFGGGAELTVDEDFFAIGMRGQLGLRSRRILEWFVTCFAFATCEMQIS